MADQSVRTLQLLLQKTAQLIGQIRQFLAGTETPVEQVHAQRWLDCLLDLRMILSGLTRSAPEPGDQARWHALGLDFLKKVDLLVVARSCTHSLRNELRTSAALLPLNLTDSITEIHEGVRSLINDARLEKSV